MAVWKRILVSGSNISDLNNNVGYATTGSNTFQGNQTINGNVIITGSLTAQQYILSSSVIYVTESNYSGSHVFGNSLDDTHQFTGSVLITGSSTLVGNQTITGSILMSGSLTDAYISTVNWIDFNSNIPAGSPAFNTGRLHWVDDTKTLGLDTDVNGSVIELGHQNVVRVVNNTGVTISKGRVVYISGSSGTRPGIATASYTDENDSATTLGFVMHDIVGSGGNTNGYVVSRGLIREVNTSGMIAGASLYLSSSGQYSTSKPQAPLHDVRLGKVIVGNSTNAGVIYVDIQNGYEIDELHNVRIIGDTTGDLIIKSGSLWINSKILTGSYTLSGSLTTNDGVSVQTLTASFVSASSGITGSLFGTASWAQSASQALTASYTPNALITASVSSNVLTFTKGNGTTFNLTVDTGSGGGGTPGGSNTEIQFNSGSTFSGSQYFAYIYESQSLQQGSNTQAIGNYSHAEGENTKTGIHTAYSASISSGIITLSSSYGDISANFTANSRLLIYDAPFDNVVGKINTLISQSYYNAPNTIIELLNNPLTTTTAYVGDIANITSWTGEQTIPGNYSHAEGKGNITLGDNSHAEGENTKTVGRWSHAEGYISIAIGPHSHAEGNGTQAIGDRSHAEGSNTKAINNNSHAEGQNTQAKGEGSHAEGSYTQAIGDSSHAEGYTVYSGCKGYLSSDIGVTNPGDIYLNSIYGDVTSQFSIGGYIILDDTSYSNTYSTTRFEITNLNFDGTNTIITLINTLVSTPTANIGSIGNIEPTGANQLIGTYSHAEGNTTQAIGYSSHAEGNTTQTIGPYSHAEGNGTQAIGNTSHAEGSNTQAIGDASHAEGTSTQAIGGFSHAEGVGTQTIGDYSHAEGNTTKAIGWYSHAEGYSSKTGYKGFSSNDIGTTTPGDIYLDSSYGDVSALFVGGNFIILSDTDDDNNYGTVKLEIASSTFDGTNTIITLVNTSISTTVAAIGVFNDPEPVGADQFYIGWYSHAEGVNTQAIGWYSHAEGDNTKAIGDYSHAEGTGTQAIGEFSHAEGTSTITLGSYSHTAGEGTIASGSAQNVVGKYNTQNNITDLFVVGGGSADNDRKDVFNVSTSSISLNATSSITGSLTVTNGITGSLFGTASWANNALTASFLPVGTYNITASQALTASFTPNALVTASVSSNVLTFTKGNGTTFNLTVNTGSGGGGTPGGGNTDIQINSGSSFYGTTDFQFQWDPSQQNREQLRHRYQYNFAGNPYTIAFNSSYVPINRANDLGQQAGITHWQTSLAATTAATTIYAFDAGMNAGTTLQMYGFKCDYSIMLNDGTNNVAARVGTLMGAWNNNTAATPSIVDNYADGDVDLLELGTVVFTLIWTGNNIELQMDCTNVTSGDTYFNGVFTNFGSTV